MDNDKLKGCLVYGAIGDAIGSRFEGGQPIEDVHLDFHWTVSDDTQLTLATCEAIYDHGVIPERIAMNFLGWFNKRRLTGLGASTLKALRELQVGGHWALVGNTGEYAAGNGGAMRIAPLAFKKDVERFTIRDVCSITHKNDEAYAGALPVYHAVVCAHSGVWTGGHDLIEKVVYSLPDTNVKDRLIELNSFKGMSIPVLGESFKSTGYVVDSVPISIFAAQQIGQLSAPEIFRQLVRIGGDTDTICSMTGQIIGALLGYDSICAAWQSKFDNNLNDIRELIDLIVNQWRE